VAVAGALLVMVAPENHLEVSRDRPVAEGRRVEARGAVVAQGRVAGNAAEPTLAPVNRLPRNTAFERTRRQLVGWLLHLFCQTLVLLDLRLEISQRWRTK